MRTPRIAGHLLLAVTLVGSVAFTDAGKLDAVDVVQGTTAPSDAYSAATERLRDGQMDLATTGKSFLIAEGTRSSFVLVGGLHGDKETPALVQSLFAALQPAGYRYLATEISPWAAGKLSPNVWGCDIENLQLSAFILSLAAASPESAALHSMAEIVKGGYRQALAPQLLTLAAGIDAAAPHVSPLLRTLLMETLQVESTRQAGNGFDGSVEREAAMKQLFIAQYHAASSGGTGPKVLLAFGTNHLHRGIDRRGVSTLGNFVAELAAAENRQSFHIALFGAGGQYNLAGLHDADQRKDDAAFEVLASLARFPATVFDLRPLRPALHAMKTLTVSEAALEYWADSYDAIVCYKAITPAGASSR